MVQLVKPEQDELTATLLKILAEVQAGGIKQIEENSIPANFNPTSPDPLRVQQAVSSLGLNIPEAPAPLDVSQVTQFLNPQGPQMDLKDFPDKGGFLDPGLRPEKIPQQASGAFKIDAAKAEPSGEPTKTDFFLKEILPALIAGGIGAAGGGFAGAGASLTGFNRANQLNTQREFEASESEKQRSLVEALEGLRQDRADERNIQTNRLGALKSIGAGAEIPKELLHLFPPGTTHLPEEEEIRFVTEKTVNADGSETEQTFAVRVNERTGATSRTNVPFATSTKAAQFADIPRLEGAQLADTEQDLQMLGLVQTIKDNAKKEFVGPWQGGVLGRARTFGGERAGLTKEESEFRSALSLLETIIFKEQIGSARTEVEMKALRTAFAAVKNSDFDFQTKLNLFEKLLRDGMDIRSALTGVPIENFGIPPQTPPLDFKAEPPSFNTAEEYIDFILQ